MTGPEIIRIRKALGLTQRELAIRLGVVTGTVCSWEQDRTRCRGPAALMLQSMAKEAQDRLRAEADALG